MNWITGEAIAIASIRQIALGPLHAIEEALREAIEEELADDSPRVTSLALARAELDAWVTSTVKDARSAREASPAAFAVGALVEQTCDMFAIGLSESVKIRCAGVAPNVVIGDAKAIRAAIVALVANAVAATSGGEVLVSTEVVGETRDDLAIRFGVTDTGFGVHQRSRARVEDAFAGRIGVASGLGLVGAIARQSGGNVGFESEPGRGATFWFAVPFARVQAMPVPSIAAPRIESDAPVLDRSTLLAYFTSYDDRDALARVCDVFIRESSIKIGEIESALRDRDSRSLERSAHALKGSCANFGALRLLRIVAELEARGHRGSTPRVFAHDLRAELNDIRVALDALIANFNASPRTQRVA